MFVWLFFGGRGKLEGSGGVGGRRCNAQPSCLGTIVPNKGFPLKRRKGAFRHSPNKGSTKSTREALKNNCQTYMCSPSKTKTKQTPSPGQQIAGTGSLPSTRPAPSCTKPGLRLVLSGACLAVQDRPVTQNRCTKETPFLLRCSSKSVKWLANSGVQPPQVSKAVSQLKVSHTHTHPS